MRIAVVTDAFPSVSETFVTEQARGLVALGHDVTVFGYAEDPPGALPPELAGRGRHRHHVPHSPVARVLGAVGSVLSVARTSPVRGWRFLRALLGARGDSPLGLALWGAPLLAERPFDVVICHFGWNAASGAALLPAMGPGTRLVAVLHGADLTSWVEDDGPERYALVFERAALLLPISDRWRALLLDWGAPPDRTAVHRVGIDLAAITPAVPEDRDEVRLLSIARLVEKKGIEFAIRAVAAVDDPRIRYDVVGDGPLGPELEQLIAELGVGERVRLLGSKQSPEVAALLASSDVVLAPSVTAADGDQEGIPVAIMEAMAAELPVVTTYHSGIPELVAHGVTGLLVEERDVEGLASAIKELVADPARRRALGREGRRVVAERHDNVRLHEALAARLGALG
jgi:colanic acid/amylovoran biosynthesis glycosyltransferase